MPDETRDTQTSLFDGPDYWVVYPTAYWEAAEKILDESRDNSFLLHPGLFLVRHYVELTFKQLIHGAGDDVPITHRLDVLWQKARRVPAIAKNKHASQQVLRSIAAYVKELTTLDPTSFSFRYPVDTAGDPRGLDRVYSARRVLEWARQLREAFAALEGAIEIWTVEEQYRSEMLAEYGP